MRYVDSVYQGSTCKSDQILQTIGFPNNQCIQLTATGAAIYNQTGTYGYPTSLTCTNETPHFTPNPSGCATNMDDDDDWQYNTYQEVSLVYGASPSSNSNGDNLSAGAIAGITIGVIVFVGLLVGIIYFLFLRKAVAK